MVAMSASITDAACLHSSMNSASAGLFRRRRGGQRVLGGHGAKVTPMMVSARVVNTFREQLAVADRAVSSAIERKAKLHASALADPVGCISLTCRPAGRSSRRTAVRRRRR